jgi:hypothetical protein
MYLTYCGLPKDKMELARKISSLDSRVEDQMRVITEQGNKITELRNALTESENAVKAAKAETEQAKTATPRRYEVVKEGSSTWRLEQAPVWLLKIATLSSEFSARSHHSPFSSLLKSCEVVAKKSAMYRCPSSFTRMYRL